MQPAGSIVRITFDGLRRLEPGDVLQTKTGRGYVIMTVRVQQRGVHRGRQHLLCLVATEPPPGAIVYPLRWYPRDRKPREGGPT